MIEFLNDWNIVFLKIYLFIQNSVIQNLFEIQNSKFRILALNSFVSLRGIGPSLARLLARSLKPLGFSISALGKLCFPIAPS